MMGATKSRKRMKKGTVALQQRPKKKEGKGPRPKKEKAKNLSRNITGRQLAEEKLRESEERFSTAFHANPAPMAIITAEDGIVLDVNDKWLNMIGFDRNELIGRCSAGLPIWVDEEARASLARKFFKEGFLKDELFQIRTKSGEIRDTLWSAESVKYEDKEAVLSLLYDITEFKRAEKAVRESERKYRLLFENAKEGILIAQDGKIQFANLAAAKLLDRSTEYLSSQPFTLFIHPEDRNLVHDRHVRRSAGEELPAKYDFRVVTPDGTVKWVEINVTQILWNNRPATMTFIIDITERIEMEAALRQSEERLRLITDNMTDMVLMTDKGGIAQYLSPATFGVTGYDQRRGIGRSIFELIHPEDKLNVQRMFARVIASQVPEKIEYRYRHARGEYVWLESAGKSMIDADGESHGFVCSVRDITDRKRAEDVLRESEERYRIAIEHPNDGVVIIQKDRRLLVSNKFREILGYKPGENDGKPFLFSVHPDDREEFREKIRRRLNGKDVPSNYELRLIKKDGSVIYVDCTVVKVMYQGEPASLGYVRDITERKKMEDDLKKSRDGLRLLAARLDKIREEERAKVALEIHDELGQHITAMKMGLAWLRDRLPNDKDGLHEKAEILTKDADVAVKMIRRISTGLRPPILDDVGLEAAMEWQARDFQNKTGILCRFKMSSTGLGLDDERSTAVFRIAQESLTNVVRHSGATRVLIDIREKEGNMFLKIKDNGRGMDKGVTSDKSLGIIGMKERALSLGGFLEIHSAREKGTVVTLVMPIQTS